MGTDEKKTESLEDAAGHEPQGIVAEYVGFLRHSKKWWLVPILVAVVILGVLTILASTGAAPFLYTLF